MMDAMTAILPPRALIGMVHVQALPGTPGSRLSVDQIVEVAAGEARVLGEAGFDGIIVENMHDRPYVHGVKPPEVVAGMTRAALAVREAVARMPAVGRVGVQVLSGGNREALAVALAAGCSFIRCENFVFSHVADEGLLAEAEAGALLRYRRAIGAERVAVFCDIKKKHASHAITADVSLAECAEAAEFFGADGVIVTGSATGKPTPAADVSAVRKATKLPVLVGSGVGPEQVKPLFGAGADALIVGSWIKKEGVWSNPVDAERCRRLVEARR
jgi:membrane complex biogenesis BtpA family protein